MKGSFWPVVVVVVVAVLAGVAWYMHSQSPQTPPVAAAPATPAPAPQPQTHYPVESTEAVPAKPLPALEASDAEVQEALAETFGRKALAELFQLNGIIRRIVATIDNLPRERVSGRLLAVKPAPGHFIVSGQGDSLALSADNYSRYTPYVRFAEGLDAKKLVAVYAHFYPLFQQAYVDLGYPDGYFNDRLVAVIDNLLAAPELPAPPKLQQPNVLYTYADPELESLSAGQKALLRMGPQNAAVIKAKLREIRVQVTSQVHKS